MEGEAAKTTNLDPFSGGEILSHLLDHGLDGKFDIFVGKVFMTLRQQLYEFRFCHPDNPLTRSNAYNPLLKLDIDVYRVLWQQLLESHPGARVANLLTMATTSPERSFL